MEIIKYVKYCLSLFEECTVNGLGTFRFTEAPAEKDSNNNLIKKKYHIIAFQPHSTAKPRLINIIAGKEGCSVEQAAAAINRYVESIQNQLTKNKEVWISEIGLLKKEENRVLLLSHKFPVKSFKSNHTAPIPKQAAIASVGAPSTHLPDTEDLVEFSTASEAVVEPPIQTSAFIQKEKAIVSTNQQTPAIAAIHNNTSAAVSHTPVSNVAAASAPVTAAPLSKAERFADNHGKIQPHQDALTIPAPRLKLYSHELYTKAMAFSRKYVVHIGIAIGLLIATIITINFYMSEKKIDSLNANNTLAPSLGNEETTDQSSTVPDNIQFGETVKNKQVSVKDNKNNQNTNKENTANKTGIDTEKSIPVLFQDQSQGALVATNQRDSEATAADHMPASTSEREIPEPSKPAPELVSATTTNNGAAEKKESATTSNAVITEPQFPGGEKGIEKYIRNKVQYPDKALEEGISGSVKVSFSVDEDGRVINPVILEGLGGGCNEEAIRVISKMPRWTPGTRDGNKIPARKTIKITFKQASR
jgi:periplasmic protein TonB